MDRNELNKEAVFSDGTRNFCNPPEVNPGDEVNIRIRTAKENIEKVLLVVNGTAYEMIKESSDFLFDFYRVKIKVGEETMQYHFVLYHEGTEYYYSRVGIVDRDTCRHYCFTLIPGFSTPEWAKGAVMYQIYVDRFYNGDVSNDVNTNEYYYLGDYSRRVKYWDQYPASMGVREFYGGDLAGIIKKLDYLQDLGIEAIYLNPIFVSPSNHKYDTQDYDNVDPHYGVIKHDGGKNLPAGETDNRKATKYQKRVTDKENLEASNRLFAELVQEAHCRGIKVILDGVFNHCGSFNKWLDREKIYNDAPDYPPGAYTSEDSPYRRFFSFAEECWPDNGSYEGWWGHKTLPKLNYEESPELEEYILQVAKKWLQPPYNIDGWRLDVAADLGKSLEYNHAFWKKFRKTVKETNPDALILAEHYGDPYEWLQGQEWDSVMNYDAFMEPVTWFLTGMEKHSYENNWQLLSNHEHFFGAMRHFMTRFSNSSLQTAMNQLSNHDHSRFLTRTNKRVGRTSDSGPHAANEGLNPAVMREAVVIQFTWIGAPAVYYGDEAGVCGWSDPDNRRTYPWGREDRNMLRFHKEMIHLHRAYPALKTGSLMFLCGEPGVVAYGRFDGTDRFVIVVNNNPHTYDVRVPVWKLGIMDEEALCTLVRTEWDGFGFEARISYPSSGILHLRMEAFSALVFKNIGQLA